MFQNSLAYIVKLGLSGSHAVCEGFIRLFLFEFHMSLTYTKLIVCPLFNAVSTYGSKTGSMYIKNFLLRSYVLKLSKNKLSLSKENKLSLVNNN